MSSDEGTYSEAIAAVAERRSRSEALTLRLALRVTMLAAQQNRETLDSPSRVTSDKLLVLPDFPL